MNLQNITAEWLIKTFEELGDEYGNGDYIEDVSIKTNMSQNYTEPYDTYEDGIKITFKVWYNNWGTFMTEREESSIIIRKDGSIQINLPEFLEGGDIDCKLKTKIKELLEIEMEQPNPNQRVQELYKQIEDAKNELAEIRKKCPHKNHAIKNYMWAPGHIEQGHVCDNCGEYLGEMKTTKEWIEEPRFFVDDKHKTQKIKNTLLQNEYSDELITWDQFEKLTNFSELCK